MSDRRGHYDPDYGDTSEGTSPLTMNLRLRRASHLARTGSWPRGMGDHPKRLSDEQLHPQRGDDRANSSEDRHESEQER